MFSKSNGLLRSFTLSCPKNGYYAKSIEVLRYDTNYTTGCIQCINDLGHNDGNFIRVCENDSWKSDFDIIPEKIEDEESDKVPAQIEFELELEPFKILSKNITRRITKTEDRSVREHVKKLLFKIN